MFLLISLIFILLPALPIVLSLAHCGPAFNVTVDAETPGLVSSSQFQS
jgi:hypothetical protein